MFICTYVDVLFVNLLVYFPAKKNTLLLFFTENIVNAICEDKDWGEDRNKQMLDILLKPHKHKDRKGGLKKSATTFEGASLVHSQTESPTKKGDTSTTSGKSAFSKRELNMVILYKHQ